MADPLLDIDSGGRSGTPAGGPRSVKVSGVIGLVVGVLVVLMLTGLIGVGAHTPGRHLTSAGTPSSSAGQGVQQS